MLENKIIQSESNFIATVKELNKDIFLYHRKGAELFKTSNDITYYIAIKYDNKLYDTGIYTLRQYDNYDFNTIYNKVKRVIDSKDLKAFKGGFDNFVKHSLIPQINAGAWVYIRLLEVLKGYDLKHGSKCLEKALNNRKAIKEENKRRDLQRKEERKKREEEQRLKEQEEQKLKDIENFCNGFTDNKNPMQQQRIADTLNRLVRVDGVVYRRKENILNKLNEGYKPTIKPLYNKNHILKDKLVLENAEGWFVEVTKTEYDYATYLLNELGLENAKYKMEG